MSELAHRIELTAKDQKIEALEAQAKLYEGQIAELEKALNPLAECIEESGLDQEGEIYSDDDCGNCCGCKAKQALANLAEFRKGLNHE